MCENDLTTIDFYKGNRVLLHWIVCVIYETAVNVTTVSSSIT